MDLLCFCSVLWLLCLCVRLFICALWSPAGKGLTSWLSFVVPTVSLSLSHWYPGSGVVLDFIDSWSLHPYLLWYKRAFYICCEYLNILFLDYAHNVLLYYTLVRSHLEFTLLIRFWFMLIGGWKCLLCLRNSIIDSEFAGLYNTNHLAARACILTRSAFSSSAPLMGVSTII